MAKFAEEAGTAYPAGDLGTLAPTSTFGGAASAKAGGVPMTNVDSGSVPQWVAYDRQARRPAVHRRSCGCQVDRRRGA